MSNLRKKIGFMGLAMSGKSHIGRLWADKTFERTGKMPLRVDISLPLKKQAAELLNIPLSVVESDKQNLRVLLQELGRLERQYRGGSYLIDEAVKQAEAFDFAYIENVRMPDEVARLTQDGWLLIGVILEDDSVRIQRFIDTHGRPPTEAEATHETERHIIPMIESGACHFVIRNQTPEDADNVAEWLSQWAAGVI